MPIPIRRTGCHSLVELALARFPLPLGVPRLTRGVPFPPTLLLFLRPFFVLRPPCSEGADVRAVVRADEPPDPSLPSSTCRRSFRAISNALSSPSSSAAATAAACAAAAALAEVAAAAAAAAAAATSFSAAASTSALASASAASANALACARTLQASIFFFNRRALCHSCAFLTALNRRSRSLPSSASSSARWRFACSCSSR
mmetsp:Transcript_21647/g.48774  ORF Transcript_21647/g.48774 Transcript_21647/m.48774 type:complete len:202 (-) Transcript_21647:415-1020(-)